MKKILSLFTITFLLISCQGQPAKEVQTIDEKSYSVKLNSIENPQLLDVRTPEEYSIEHIENAINVNWNGNDFESKAATYNKSKPIFVYCKVGGRSAQAANKLAEMGFTEIYNLDGGIMKWTASGMETRVEGELGETKSSNKIIGMCDQEYSELIKSDKKVMVNFFAKWCEPCKKMQPYILKMQEKMKEQLKIVRLDADENKTILDGLKLDGLPVIILYENGKETWRNIGFISEDDLKKHL